MHPFDDGDFGEEGPNDKELNQLIDEWLASDRPERYDSGEKEWMDAAVAKTRDEMRRQRADDELVRDAARRRVYQREGQATKRANKVLRDINDTGQLPLGWGDGDNWRAMLFDVLHLPLSIDRQRVRFGASSATDLTEWELENAREQDKRDEAQIKARGGARLVAEWVRGQGVQRVEDLRPDGNA